MITQLARNLGWPRVVIAGALLLLGIFFVFALSQAGHFGWGFRFLDAALRYALIAPVILLVDTVVAIVQLIARRRQQELPQQRGGLVGYLLVMWVLWGAYFLVARS